MGIPDCATVYTLTLKLKDCGVDNLVTSFKTGFSDGAWFEVSILMPRYFTDGEGSVDVEVDGWRISF